MENDDQAPDVGNKDGLAGGDLAHTPGPWVWSGHPFSALSGPDGGDILHYTNRDDGLHGTEADKRLIAASPELLRALRLLWAETVLSGNDGATDFGWTEARKATLSAIAKATEGEPANNQALPQGGE